MVRVGPTVQQAVMPRETYFSGEKSVGRLEDRPGRWPGNKTAWKRENNKTMGSVTSIRTGRVKVTINRCRSPARPLGTGFCGRGRDRRFARVRRMTLP